MPKILQINASANWGSTGRIAEDINNAARKYGWDTYIAYSRVANKSNSELIRIGNKFDVLLAVLETRLFDRAGLGMRTATKRLINRIRTIKPDIIHLHNIHGYVLNYEMLFKYLCSTDIKVVWTFHDFWAITGHCFHFSGIKCNKWQIQCQKCPLHGEYPSSITDFSKRNYKRKKKWFSANKNLTIVSVSKWVDTFLPFSFLKSADHLVIDNGVDTAIFKPTAGFRLDSISEDDFLIIGVASQWGVGKGFEDFMALSELLQPDEKILLVGLTKQAISKLPPNVIGIERTNSAADLAAAYSRADVFISFSRAETFGLTVVESMACGTPVIVYDNSAPPYLVAPGTGYVVPDGDYLEAYSRIKEIKMNGKTAYSKECIRNAAENYTIADSYKKYVDLYNRLLKA